MGELPAGFETLETMPVFKPSPSFPTFSAWKFDIIKAMIADPGLSRGDLGVAISILSHINERTMDCFPSEQLLADEAGLKTVRGVRMCLRNLERRRWIEIVGKGRRRTNRFRVLETNANASLDRLLSLREDRKEARESRKARSPFNAIKEEPPFPTDQNSPSPKHLN